jgi:hypothetical protein
MVIVFIAALIFTNAIEWIASQLKLGCSFVGAIIAPLFTSIPEMVVFLVAIFAYSGEAGKDIGVGTIYGQPFMASSFHTVWSASPSYWNIPEKEKKRPYERRQQLATPFSSSPCFSFDPGTGLCEQRHCQTFSLPFCSSELLFIIYG